METDLLIQQLEAKLAEGRPFWTRGKLKTAWWLIPTLVVLAPVARLGLRSDLAAGEPTQGLSLYLAGLVLAFAGLAQSAWMSGIPGQRPGMAPRALMAVAVLTVSLGLALMARSGLQSESLSAGLNASGRACSITETVLAITPALVFYLLFTKLAPVRTRRTGTLGLAAIGLLSLLALGLHCPSDNPVHIVIWHFLPVVAFTIAGGVAAKKLLAW